MHTIKRWVPFLLALASLNGWLALAASGPAEKAVRTAALIEVDESGKELGQATATLLLNFREGAKQGTSFTLEEHTSESFPITSIRPTSPVSRTFTASQQGKEPKSLVVVEYVESGSWEVTLFPGSGKATRHFKGKYSSVK